MKMATLAAAAALALCATGAQAASFGTNLVTNGDAEAGSTTGFTTTGDLTVLAYNQGGYPSTGDPGVAEGGNFLFTGGYVGLSTGEQIISVTNLGSSIDGGGVKFDLSAFLGGYSSQEDNASLMVTFEDDLGTSLGTASLGAVTAADRADQTGLLFRSASGFVPAGTRNVDLLLTATRLQGSANDGYADNLSFVLSPGDVISGAPEPSVWAMMLGGVAMLGSVLRSAQARRREREALA